MNSQLHKELTCPSYCPEQGISLSHPEVTKVIIIAQVWVRRRIHLSVRCVLHLELHWGWSWAHPSVCHHCSHAVLALSEWTEP